MALIERGVASGMCYLSYGVLSMVFDGIAPGNTIMQTILLIFLAPPAVFILGLFAGIARGLYAGFLSAVMSRPRGRAYIAELQTLAFAVTARHPDRSEASLHLRHTRKGMFFEDARTLEITPHLNGPETDALRAELTRARNLLLFEHFAAPLAHLLAGYRFSLTLPERFSQHDILKAASGHTAIMDVVAHGTEGRAAA